MQIHETDFYPHVECTLGIYMSQYRSMWCNIVIIYKTGFFSQSSVLFYCEDLSQAQEG